jgi:hypothetical protein
LDAFLSRDDAPARAIDLARALGDVARHGARVISVRWGPGFIAWNPVRVVFAPTDATPSGSNYHVGGTSGDCPAMLLADWQADIVLSTSPPPSIPTGASPEVKVGTSRDQVAWIRGYPNEVGDRATLRKQAAWRYGTMPMNSSTITFDDDRVASVTRP